MKDLHCKGITCGNCPDFMYLEDGSSGIRKCALGIPDILKSIEYCLKIVNSDDFDPQVAIIGLRDTQEVKDAELSDLAWAIYRDENAHKNDIIGFVESLEKYLTTKSESK